MDTQKIRDLIDKVIGKDGPLRAPAYWMGKVLRDMLANLDELNQSMLTNLAKLEDTIKRQVAACLQRIPAYTYDELKSLKDNGLLIPGQQYKITDYKPFFRQSYQWIEVSSDVAKGAIIVKAITESEFDEHAILIRGGTEYYCKYCFDKKPQDFNWCPTEYDYGAIVELETNLTYERSKPTDTPSLEDLQTNFPRNYIFYSRNGKIQRAIRVDDGKLFEVVDTANLNPLSYSIFGYERYKGIIYELKYKNEPKRLPYDPLHLLYFTEEFSGMSVVGELPLDTLQYQHNVGSSIYIADNIGAVNTPGTYTSQPCRKLPLIRLSGLRGATAALAPPCSIYIGSNCSKIIAVYSREASLYIEGNSSNIWLRFVNARIAARSSNIYAQWPVQNLNLIGNCTNITVRNSSYQNISADPLVMPCSIEVHSSKNVDLNLNLKTLPKANVVVWPLQLTEKTTISLNGIVESDFEGCLFVGRDSNSNIMQWNPADVVDAVDVEEQIVENVEE